MSSLFSEVHDARVPLLDVLYFRSEGLIVGVRLVFETRTLDCLANPDDDTIAISAASAVPEAELSSCVHPVWLRAIGRPLMWTWSLENNQGYWDAIQLEFAHDSGDRDVISIQLLVMASQITFYSLTQLPMDPNPIAQP